MSVVLLAICLGVTPPNTTINLTAHALWDGGATSAACSLLVAPLPPVFVCGGLPQDSTNDNLLIGRTLRVWYRLPQGDIETDVGVYLGAGQVQIGTHQLRLYSTGEVR